MRIGTAPYRLRHELRRGGKSLVTRKDLLAAKGISDPDRAMRQWGAANLVTKLGRGRWQVGGGPAHGVFADVIPKRRSDFDAEKHSIATLAAEAYREGITLYVRRA